MGPVGEAADVMTDGAKKYGQNEKWRDVPPLEHYNSLMRHLDAWRSGSKKDGESGLNHLAHVLARVCLLMETDKEESPAPEMASPAPEMASPELVFGPGSTTWHQGSDPASEAKEKLMRDTSHIVDSMVERFGNERRAIAYLLGEVERISPSAQARRWYYVWPDGTYCGEEELSDSSDKISAMGDYDVKMAIGYDSVGEPVFV